MQPNSSLSSRAASGGFTLIELLLAIAIAAVVVTVVNATFFESHRVIEQVDDQTRTYQMARTALERMSRDLSCAYVPLARPLDAGGLNAYQFEGIRTDEGNQPADRLSFTTTAALGFEQDYGTAEVAYYLEPMEDHHELYRLMRRENGRPHASDSKQGATVELAENISGLRLSYLQTDGTALDSWSLKSRLKLAPQVKIVLTVRQGQQELPFTATVSLPLSSGELSASASSQGPPAPGPAGETKP